MKPFMGTDFLLTNETAVTLFHNYAKNTPILDYHCHINPREIAEDHVFQSITQIWLAGDHYKWRLMRSFGIDEHYITGSASDKEKFFKWAEVLGKAVGNPLFHWSHLELQRYFDYYGILNAQTAQEVWTLCNEKLQTELSVRTLIKKSDVRLICTTDDPSDSLEWHCKLAEDTSFDVTVLPAFRPDRAMNIERYDYLHYLDLLSSKSGISIYSFAALKEALLKRMDFFSQMGCLIADHGLDYILYLPATDDEVEAIFEKRLIGDDLSEKDINRFKTFFLQFVAKEYHRRNWVMQLHYGCKRNNNTSMLERLGPDTGYDCISNEAPASQMADFLNSLEITDELPKTILYSLNPADNAVIDTIIGCFQSSATISKLQHGAAWWFNDNKIGMEQHLQSLANLGNLSGFVGMLTDSRSFLSYTRHEYFRRILCNFLGSLVENGEYPNEIETLGEIVQDICYYNAVRYFEFTELETPLL